MGIRRGATLRFGTQTNSYPATARNLLYRSNSCSHLVYPEGAEGFTELLKDLLIIESKPYKIRLIMSI